MKLHPTLDNCKLCKTKFINQFDTVGKTFYITKDDNSILCHRHYHLEQRPAVIAIGEYQEITAVLRKLTSIYSRR
jgi:hypothetical protein